MLLLHHCLILFDLGLASKYLVINPIDINIAEDNIIDIKSILEIITWSVLIVIK